MSRNHLLQIYHKLTIRRLDEFWGGNFSDQTIEQFQIRMIRKNDAWSGDHRQYLN